MIPQNSCIVFSNRRRATHPELLCKVKEALPVLCGAEDSSNASGMKSERIRVTLRHSRAGDAYSTNHHRAPPLTC